MFRCEIIRAAYRVTVISTSMTKATQNFSTLNTNNHAILNIKLQNINKWNTDVKTGGSRYNRPISVFFKTKNMLYASHRPFHVYIMPHVANVQPAGVKSIFQKEKFEILLLYNSCFELNWIQTSYLPDMLPFVALNMPKYKTWII